uniref:Uncharacterized protein n=1 Tax=Molossus molossus TaxID=27622 RepID=A0A7J8F9B1_MOLMO|nr:hypothetical protein HJG59_008625 [Molossus molossus]
MQQRRTIHRHAHTSTCARTHIQLHAHLRRPRPGPLQPSDRSCAPWGLSATSPGRALLVPAMACIWVRDSGVHLRVNAMCTPAVFTLHPYSDCAHSCSLLHPPLHGAKPGAVRAGGQLPGPQPEPTGLHGSESLQRPWQVPRPGALIWLPQNWD